ncbi:MAG: HpsJ family protein [Prochloraceae cyanobacterium]
MFNFNKLNSKQGKKFPNLKLLAIHEGKNTKLIHLLGCSILIFSLFRLAYLLIHCQFFDPQAETLAIGKAIQTVWTVLLGFILIFYRPKKSSIKIQEFKKLSRLSWLALCLGIFYLLTLFPLLNNGIIIAENNRIIAREEIQIQTLQLKQFEQRLVSLDSVNSTRFLQLNKSPKFSIYSPEQFRDKLIKTLQERCDRLEQKLTQQLRAQQINLIKITLKLTFGAIIAGTSLILIWKWLEEGRDQRANSAGKFQFLKAMHNSQNMSKIKKL